MSKGLLIKRVKTGIPGLDDILSGGIPKGNTILLLGPAGSGKTIFGLQYIVNGAEEYGEKGIYISFEQNKEDLLQQALAFDWDLEKLEKEGKIAMFFLKRNDVFSLTKMLEEVVQNFSPQRVVLDSLTFYYTYATIYAYTEEYIKSTLNPIRDEMIKYSREMIARNTILDLVTKLKELGLTSILIAESLDEKREISIAAELAEFICDGVIYLTVHRALNLRKLEIVKMRATEHTLKPQTFRITNNGIVLGSES